MIPGEIYARHVIPVQPGPLYHLGADESVDETIQLVERLSKLEWFLHNFMTMHPSFEQQKFEFAKEDSDLEQWARRVAHLLGKRPHKDDLCYSRKGPDWEYWRGVKSEISLFRSPELYSAIESLHKASDVEQHVLDGVNGRIWQTGNLRNFVPAKEERRARKALQALAGQGEPIFTLLENRIIAALGEYVLAIPAEAGKAAFDSEREAVLARHQRESSLLFPPDEYLWATAIDGHRFEALIYDLITREPGVVSVRQVGGTRERDGGRDLLVEWITPPQNPNLAIPQGVPVQQQRLVVVQCKALASSVGKNKIPDIRDTLEHNDAQGYLLAASGTIATSAIDYLLRLRQKGDIFTDWWSRPEIEAKLRRNPDIAGRYPDIARPR
ncbi:restriction endonuclease [Streptosporangium sp. NPDC006930]|uniref:restriction endonuclease n=1 Tax=Streptosporangium sp. NPDC006930 TaxID=3154783 RepID=UPI00342ABBCE